MRLTLIAALFALWLVPAWAQDDATAEEALADSAAAKQPPAAEQATTEDESEAEANIGTGPDDEPNGDGIKSPKTMSGMSILGNEEAPKALVIIPWKSSRMGDALSLTDTLDDRAQPVDKEVFLRELKFYQIRSGDRT